MFRFMFRSLLLMIVGSVVMSVLWRNRFVREGGLSAPISHVASEVAGGGMQMFPHFVPGAFGSSVHAGSRGEEIFFSPTDDLERIDIGLIREARSSIDIAMYAFTDPAIAQALSQKAREGIRIRIYRDRFQFQQEQEHGGRVMHVLAGQQNIQVRVKGSNDLMHDKIMLIDDSTLRDGSGNWSISAARYQDNQVTVSHAAAQIAAFQRGFTAMWNRPGNEAVQ